jgi:hypothetical protein
MWTLRSGFLRSTRCGWSADKGYDAAAFVADMRALK